MVTLHAIGGRLVDLPPFTAHAKRFLGYLILMTSTLVPEQIQRPSGANRFSERLQHPEAVFVCATRKSNDPFVGPPLGDVPTAIRMPWRVNQRLKSRPGSGSRPVVATKNGLINRRKATRT